MGFRHVGWSMIILGALMAIVGGVAGNATALVVALFGVSLVLSGIVALWFGSMENGGLHSGERWTRRAH